LLAAQATREAVRRMSCTNNLKQLGIAAHNHHDSKGKFPPDFLTRSDRLNIDEDHRALGWNFFLFPFMEQQAIYDIGTTNLKRYNGC
jgi:hypothetical protein